MARYGKRVRFYATGDQVDALEQQKSQGKAGRIALRLPRTDRVILDESGWLPPFSPAGAALRFHRLSRLYEHASAMVMSTHYFADWSSAFGATKVTTSFAGPAHAPLPHRRGGQPGRPVAARHGGGEELHQGRRASPMS